MLLVPAVFILDLWKPLGRRLFLDRHIGVVHPTMSVWRVIKSIMHIDSLRVAYRAIVTSLLVLDDLGVVPDFSLVDHLLDL